TQTPFPGEDERRWCFVDNDLKPTAKKSNAKVEVEPVEDGEDGDVAPAQYWVVSWEKNLDTAPESKPHLFVQYEQRDPELVTVEMQDLPPKKMRKKLGQLVEKFCEKQKEEQEEEARLRKAELDEPDRGRSRETKSSNRAGENQNQAKFVNAKKAKEPPVDDNYLELDLDFGDDELSEIEKNEEDNDSQELKLDPDTLNAYIHSRRDKHLEKMRKKNPNAFDKPFSDTPVVFFQEDEPSGGQLLNNQDFDLDQNAVRKDSPPADVVLDKNMSFLQENNHADESEDNGKKKKEKKDKKSKKEKKENKKQARKNKKHSVEGDEMKTDNNSDHNENRADKKANKKNSLLLPPVPAPPPPIAVAAKAAAKARAKPKPRAKKKNNPPEGQHEEEYVNEHDSDNGGGKNNPDVVPKKRHTSKKFRKMWVKHSEREWHIGRCCLCEKEDCTKSLLDTVGNEVAEFWSGAGVERTPEDEAPSAVGNKPTFHFLAASELLLCDACANDAKLMRDACDNHTENPVISSIEKVYVTLFARDYGPREKCADGRPRGNARVDDYEDPMHPELGKQKLFCPPVQTRYGCKFDTELDFRSVYMMEKIEESKTLYEALAWLRHLTRMAFMGTKCLPGMSKSESRHHLYKNTPLEEKDLEWAEMHFGKPKSLGATKTAWTSVELLLRFFGDDKNFGLSFALEVILKNPEKFAKGQPESRKDDLFRTAASLFKQIWETGRGPTFLLNQIAEAYMSSARYTKSGLRAFTFVDTHRDGVTTKTMRSACTKTAFFVTIIHYSRWGRRLEQLKAFKIGYIGHAEPQSPHQLCFLLCELRKYSTATFGGRTRYHLYIGKAEKDWIARMLADGYELFDPGWNGTKWKRALENFEPEVLERREKAAAKNAEIKEAATAAGLSVQAYKDDQKV
ncbi:unnamed protein product, partial [Amoebophrya sp. A120]